MSDLVSSIYGKNQSPREPLELDGDTLMLETRKACSILFDVPLNRLPKSWRKLAIALNPELRGSMYIYAAYLDHQRIRAGLEAGIVSWMKKNRQPQRRR